MKHLLIVLVVIWGGLLGSQCCAQEQATVEPQRTEGHFAEVNGFQMYYETYGEGEPLLLLHMVFLGRGQRGNLTSTNSPSTSNSLFPICEVMVVPQIRPGNSHIDRQPWTYMLCWTN